MKDEFSLSGAQRRYRQPGAKLLPRDAEMAMWCGHARSARERRKADAMMVKAMGGPPECNRNLERARSALSTRALKRIHREMDTGINLQLVFRFAATGRNAWLRYVNALENDRQVREAQAADAAMLRNAY